MAAVIVTLVLGRVLVLWGVGRRRAAVGCLVVVGLLLTVWSLVLWGVASLLLGRVVALLLWRIATLPLGLTPVGLLVRGLVVVLLVTAAAAASVVLVT